MTTSLDNSEDASAMLTSLWQCNSLEKAQKLINSDHVTVSNFVSNTFVARSSDEWIDSFEPKTGNLFARVQDSSPFEVEAAIDAASAAFKSWSRTTRAERSRYLQRISSLIQENRELFAVWESIDQGKTLERARIEVDRAISNFSYGFHYFFRVMLVLLKRLTFRRYFSTFILHEETTARIIDNVALTYEHRSPAGPFALISPWNMPLYLLTWKIAPCIAFGCTAVAKPSEITSMSAFRQSHVPDF